MEDGTITEKGTHEELTNLKGYYYNLLRLQEGMS
jgi:ABC-type multidrug transport system fused ATPase/permease subunit